MNTSDCMRTVHTNQDQQVYRYWKQPAKEKQLPMFTA